MSQNEYNFPDGGVNKYVTDYISSLGSLAGKRVLDCPAGDGRSSYLLKKQGADVVSADLFPEFFVPKEIQCDEVDLAKGLPYEDESFDFILCQEGIEHIQNQLMVFQEFARVLKKNGKLLITAPSVSHLRAKVSHLLTESEYFKRSAPSELDGVWFSNKNRDELYFGHVFLINIQKLRTLAVFSGLEFEKVFKSNLGTTSLLLYPLFIPFILLFNLFPVFSYAKKLTKVRPEIKKKILWDQYKLNCSFNTLVGKHTIVLLQKARGQRENIEYLRELTRGKTDK